MIKNEESVDLFLAYLKQLMMSQLNTAPYVKDPIITEYKTSYPYYTKESKLHNVEKEKGIKIEIEIRL